MQYIITAQDYKDKQALERRLQARDAHLKRCEEFKQQGTLLYALAVLNDEGKMIGSTLVVDFSSEDEVHAWLKEDPYITGKVWESLEIQLCKVAPIF